jgi:hypothetical protein
LFSPRSTLRTPRATPRRARGGFALLITITLLAFLVILLVGLATYTRVETAVAGNTQRQAQARQNALVGLNLAVAQLQKYAGPDTRVTATAESFPSVNSQKRRYTGVWHSNPAATSDTTTPLAWLVSGIETGATVDVTQAIPAASRVALTGPKTDGSTFLANGNPGANNVVAPLQSITAPGVPGVNGTPVIGRYAWWVGDQGVKAAVAVPDASTSVTYSPWNTADARLRLRQQIPLGAGAVSTSGAPVFEPRDAASSTLVSADRIVATSQLAFLRTASPTGAAVTTAASAIGLTPVLQNFHNWSPNNYAVLASTAPASAGLRRDLSLDPSLLGAGFAAWADYNSYMEPPVPALAASDPSFVTAPAFPPPSPDYSATNPVRRRYVVQPASQPAGGEVMRNVAPILSYFLLSFNIRTKSGSSAVSPIEARARWMFSLWNPYTSALVPENMRLEITGLPTIRAENDSRPASIPPFSLQDVYGSSNLRDSPLNISLPWDSTSSTAADRQSWLPGRTYTWTALQDLTAAPSDTGFASKFYSRVVLTDSQQGVILPASPVTIDGNDTVHLHGNSTALEAKLFVVRGGGDVLVATFRSPDFSDFATRPRRISDGSYQFSYHFRLAESLDGASWLSAPNNELRASSLPGDRFVAGANGPFPDLYEDFVTISQPDRLLDRATASYNEDTPVFEFPRAPILSLGALQHVALVDRRPFSLGNSWGAQEQLNGVRAFELFDRFFFSGLVPSTIPSVVGGATLLPNPLQKLIPRNPATGAPTDIVGDVMTAPAALSSKFLLQGGAFNINSTSIPAWAAVLRSVRFPAPQSFRYLDSSFGSGTTSDTNTGTNPITSADAQFFRFSHSAHETYKADFGYAASTVAPPTAPDIVSAANTHLFRQGMRTLNASQVIGLATAIVDAVKAKHAASGPFRTMEEFLGPLAGAPDSLIEQAIAAAAWTDVAGNSKIGLNQDIPEFSSQKLIQGDILTALAPVLFPRSDTFVIRAYGEAVNPATAATAGRAWCEAIVQRVPEYFDPNPATGDAPEIAPAALSSALNQANGRRFKIISFRWLTRSDL